MEKILEVRRIFSLNISRFSNVVRFYGGKGYKALMVNIKHLASVILKMNLAHYVRYEFSTGWNCVGKSW